MKQKFHIKRGDVVAVISGSQQYNIEFGPTTLKRHLLPD